MTSVKSAFSNVMEVKIRAIRDAEQAVARITKQLGPSEALYRFLSRYAKIRTQKAYLIHLQLYLRWLHKEGVNLTPDELVQDNLNCVYGASPQDVRTKGKHTDWLNKYVNVTLIERKEAHRRLAFTTIREFYKKNDSPLFGDIGVSSGPAEAPPEALPAEDVRKVLKVLPLNVKLPLLIEWQSGMEINRVRDLKWKDVEGIWKGESPLRLELFGRKKHRRPYHTFIEMDSIAPQSMDGEVEGLDEEGATSRGARIPQQEEEATHPDVGQQGVQGDGGKARQPGPGVTVKSCFLALTLTTTFIQNPRGACKGAERLRGALDGTRRRDTKGLRRQRPGPHRGL